MGKSRQEYCLMLNMTRNLECKTYQYDIIKDKTHFYLKEKMHQGSFNQFTV